MKINVLSDRKQAGRTAAAHGAALIRQALADRGSANVIVATGASQFEMLESLLEESIEWNRVTLFHLDEYVGLPISHPASFRKYLWERFHRRLPVPPAAFHYVNGEGDGAVECARLGRIIAEHPIDVCFAGIGENGHLAFNDPPADFKTEQAYLVVNLDEGCRRQQLGEGWFKSFEEVPRTAISMSIRQILRSKSIVITAPDERKAKATRDTVEGPVTETVPASILQTHSNTELFLDPPSASLLRK